MQQWAELEGCCAGYRYKSKLEVDGEFRRNGWS